MASNQDTIKRLQSLIAEAQAAIESLKEPELTREGWSAVRNNGTPPPTAHQEKFAPRHACVWNDKERRDLVSKWLQFASIETLAQTHRRTEGGIRSELQRLLYTANVDVILDEIVGPQGAE